MSGASVSIEDYSARSKRIIFFKGKFLRLHGGVYLSGDRVIFPLFNMSFSHFSDAINSNKFDVGGVQRWRGGVDIGEGRGGGLHRGAGHFGHKTLRHRDTSAPQNWCQSLRRITSGAVSRRNCPGSKCPGFSSFTALVSKCLVSRFSCRSVLSVPECLDAEVSYGRSVR